MAGESAKERFDAYLDTLRKAIELEEQIVTYEEASKNRGIVTPRDEFGRQLGA